MATPMTPPIAAPDFLARAGWSGARIDPLAGDASFRRYFRVVERDRTAVLMDAPPPHEDPRSFLAVAHYLRHAGFAAPAILADDLDHGLVLLEDFGDVRMREAIDAGVVNELDTYAAVVELLAELHRRPAAVLPPYAPHELHREARLFTDWYCPLVSIAADVVGFDQAWSAAFAAIDDASVVTVLRDYHAENIMLRDGQSGLVGFGLLDFQDALVGHPAYDLVSMLQDARRDVSIEVERAMRAHYRALAQPAPGFDAAYAILGAQRNTKIIGIFARLWRRDGKARYLDFLPRVWQYLERDLQHSALADVRQWFADNVPIERRGMFEIAR